MGKVDAVVTDPPYGVDLGNHHGAAECRAGLLVKRGGYEDSVDRFDSVVVPAVETALKQATRGAVFGVPPNIWKFPPPAALGGIFVPGAVGRNKWGWSNLIHCALYGTAPGLNNGAAPTAFVSTEIAEETGHPTTKPTGWMVRVVKLSAAPGETVLDPFMGSGTTGVACAKLGRKFIGIEIEPKYFDIACKRIDEAYKQGDFFVEKPKPATQDTLPLPHRNSA